MRSESNQLINLNLIFFAKNCSPSFQQTDATLFHIYFLKVLAYLNLKKNCLSLPCEISANIGRAKFQCENDHDWMVEFSFYFSGPDYFYTFDIRIYTFAKNIHFSYFDM
jgi:hypothetical protein